MTSTTERAVPGAGRGPQGRWERTLDSLDTDRECAELRGRGLSYRKIAEHIGYADPSSARKAVARALTAVPPETVAAARQAELDRMDYLYEAALGVLSRRAPAYQLGRLIIGPDGQPVIDSGPILGAIDRCVRISERKARLLGLDSPAVSDIRVTAQTETDREIAGLLADMIAGGRAVAEPVPTIT